MDQSNILSKKTSNIMPGTTLTFTYTMIPDPDGVAFLEKRARKVLGWACDGDKRITCHEVSGAGLGAVTLSLTIHGRDRWWATQLAQDILDRVLWGLESGATRLDLQSHKQPPHTNRGYAHGRTVTVRGARQAAAGGSSAGSSEEERRSSS